MVDSMDCIEETNTHRPPPPKTMPFSPEKKNRVVSEWMSPDFGRPKHRDSPDLPVIGMQHPSRGGKPKGNLTQQEIDQMRNRPTSFSSKDSFFGGGERLSASGSNSSEPVPDLGGAGERRGEGMVRGS